MAVSGAEPLATNRKGPKYIIGSAIICFLIVALSILTLQHRSGDDTAYMIGQFTAALFTPLLVAAVIYWVARWATHGNRARSIKIMFWGLAIWFIVMFATFIGVITSPTYLSRHIITPADEQGLVVSPDSIRHEKLGFSLPNPGGHFVRDEEVEQVLLTQFGRGRDMAVWFFRDTAQGMGLAIQVVTLKSIDEQGFRAYAREMRPSAKFATVLFDTLTWTRNRHEYTIRLRHDNGVLSITRCIPRLNRIKKLVVCVQMVGGDSENLAKVPDGLTVDD